MSKSRYLSYEDRKNIEIMLSRGIPIAEIANFLKRHRQTIYREIERCPKGNYSADEAQKTLMN
ncbi:MAG: helix-turn-helix domain-containing protein [Lachnospiraceae bacterium]|nr:helix-turn-helix domain-containing protein [Lachnospiraceae bacterium]